MRRDELETHRRDVVARHSAARADGRRARIAADEAAAVAAGVQAREAELELEQVDGALLDLTEFIAVSEVQLAAARDAALREKNTSSIDATVDATKIVLRKITQHLQGLDPLERELAATIPAYAADVVDGTVIGRADLAGQIVRAAFKTAGHDAYGPADQLVLRRLRVMAASIADGTAPAELPGQPGLPSAYIVFPNRMRVTAAKSFRWLDIAGKPETLPAGNEADLPDVLAAAAISLGAAKEVRPAGLAFSAAAPEAAWNYRVDQLVEAAARKEAEEAVLHPRPWADPGEAIDTGIDLRIEAQRSIERQREEFAARVAA